MRHYNRNTRATHRRAFHTPYAYEACDSHARAIYGGYKRTIYIADTPATRDTRATDYVRFVNAVNAVNAIITDTQPTAVHLPRAPYRQYTPTIDYITRPTPPQPSTHTDTRRVKCAVFNKYDKLIWYGVIRRTRVITGDAVSITLHNSGGEDMRVYPYIPAHNVHGYTPRELREHNVECYHV